MGAVFQERLEYYGRRRPEWDEEKNKTETRNRLLLTRVLLPWVRAYLAHVVAGPLRVLLRQTKKAKLMDEPIDRIHMVYASFNNFFVTSDRFLIRFANYFLKDTGLVVARPGEDFDKKFDAWMSSEEI